MDFFLELPVWTYPVILLAAFAAALGAANFCIVTMTGFLKAAWAWPSRVCRATLFYRVVGQEKYCAAEMKRRGSDIVGFIPMKGVMGRVVQYYLEMYDSVGNVVKRQGSATSPDVLTVGEISENSVHVDA
jgi:hypothetical protein